MGINETDYLLMEHDRKRSDCPRALFPEALPMMSLWDRLVGHASRRLTKPKRFEDNQAAITIVQEGCLPSYATYRATHGVNITSKMKLTNQNASCAR